MNQMTDVERFYLNVEEDPETGCLLWTSGTFSSGYGRFAPAQSRAGGAHVFAWKLGSGQPVPDGLLVLHRCDVRTCVRFSHLFVGTYKDNVDDMYAKGRQASPLTAARTKLTWPQVVEIRERYAAGDVPQRVLAAEFGVSISGISRLINHQYWNPGRSVHADANRVAEVDPRV